MNTIVVSSNNLREPSELPRSKSWAARFLILASLSKAEKKIHFLSSSQDTKDLLASLMAIGLKIESFKSFITIKNSFPACEIKSPERIKIDVGEGGTTIRFLIPLLSLGRNQYELIFSPSMLIRPMDDLYKTLKKLGVRVDQTDQGVVIQGPIETSLNEVEIDASLSSQFASAFAMINTIINLKMKYKNLVNSKKYFELTEKAIDIVTLEDNLYVPVDYSGIGYIIAYSFLNHNNLIRDIGKPDYFQTDIQLVNILNSIGGELEFKENTLFIPKRKKIKSGFDVDGSQCLDLIPTLAFVASFVDQTSIIRNISGLIDKESDRLKELLNILKYFSVKHDFNHDTLVIHGQTDYDKINVDYRTSWDHRMVMCVTLFTKMHGGGRLEPYTCVKKSFPNFFDIF